MAGCRSAFIGRPPLAAARVRRSLSMSDAPAKGEAPKQVNLSKYHWITHPIEVWCRADSMTYLCLSEHVLQPERKKRVLSG
eukprot:13898-Eustigmatos_ZCMA.PRE.1